MPTGIYKRIHPAWNKGIKGLQPWMNISGLSRGTSPRKGRKFGPPSDETRLKLSLALAGKNTWSKGRKLSDEHKRKIRLGHLGMKYKPWSMEARTKIVGRKHSFETIEKLKKVHTGLHVGSKNGMWKNIKKDFRDKHSLLNKEYIEWRTSVFKRDRWKCKMCGVKQNLEAHHILRWSEFSDLRYKLNNGITLCRAHHPRKRSEEAKLSPYFQQLVAETN